MVGALFAFEPLRARSRIRRARTLARNDIPEVIDLLRVAVSGGANLALAMQAVVARAPPIWRDPLYKTSRRLARGEPAPEALQELRLLSDAADPLCDALVSAAKHGTPLLATLTRIGDEARATRRRAAESAARRLPVFLIFPLIGCALPAFVLLTVVPLLAGGLRSLRL